MNGRTKGKHERQEWKEVSGNVVPSVDANIMFDKFLFSFSFSILFDTECIIDLS